MLKCLSPQIHSVKLWIIVDETIKIIWNHNVKKMEISYSKRRKLRLLEWLVWDICHPIDCQDNLSWLCGNCPLLSHWFIYVLPEVAPSIKNLMQQRNCCILLQDPLNKSEEKNLYIIIHDYKAIVIKIQCCCYKKIYAHRINSPKMN